MRFGLLIPAATAALALLEQQNEQEVLSAGEKNGEEQRGADRSPLDSDFKAFTQAALDRWKVPGVSVSVVDGDDIWAEGYGIASFPSTRATPSTLYYTGSTTKAFTAAVLSLLIASGNFTSFASSSSSSSSGVKIASSSPLGWQTPISHLIRDDFVLPPGHEWEAAHLTLEDALSHRTGFPRHDKALARRYGPEPDHSHSHSHPHSHRGTPRDVARSLRHLPAVSEPRVGWRYCNLMYMVAAHVIQTLTGRWLGDEMRERIWEPLGMHGTYLSVEEALGAGREVARGYYWDYQGEGKGSSSDKDRGKDRDGEQGKGWFIPVPYANLDLASGAGGIVSNVLDYARWIRCLIRGDGSDETENGCPVLPPSAHRELKLARIALPPETRLSFDAPLAYALGWELGTCKGRRIFTHGGGMEAYGAEVYFLPDLGFGVVTLANTAVTSNLLGMELAWKLIDDKLGVPEEERFDWVSRGKKVLETQLRLAETAIQDLYPERADPPLPHALPLEKYVGVYSHPAYQNITLQLTSEDSAEKKGEQLRAIRDDMEWQMTFDFHHVSGEFWAVVIDFLNTPNMLNGQRARAQFEISVKGTVDKLKMEFLEDGSEGIIVFDRVA
ncbi:beta-lactamase/transpeptidase-like protein [Daldinia caldariorum]|uniref:beta-lactamase/transpeptidase-like protein n=1 Tax=Daldinia caldariorum TaxID=326644 RepID=UPI002007A103|nr:beta-lactamase/transpeptidase-like protein [Daldinia caldariorum]KAI1473070.1 beta-lactamase/transpeptidase-like protein [Daldinia caldariorum]